MRLRRLCAAAMLALLVTAPTPANATQTTCQDVYTPVRFGLTQQTMYGELCVPQGATTVQVLVPGGSYTSDYWDIPIDPGVRSIRLAMNNAGIATMAVDRIGTGKSSKPLSLLVNTAAQAEAVHHVIQSLRPRFQKVATVAYPWRVEGPMVKVKAADMMTYSTLVDYFWIEGTGEMYVDSSGQHERANFGRNVHGYAYVDPDNLIQRNG